MEPTPADASSTTRFPGLAVAALASLGAGAVHAAATGIHAEHPQLARIFVVTTVLQLVSGLWALARPHRAAALAVAVVNIAAVAGWLATRLVGISWIDGLETREAAQFADTACAALGALAAGTAIAALLVGRRPATAQPRLAIPAALVAALAVPAMWAGGTHVHNHAHTDTLAAAADGHAHTDDAATGDTVHDHGATAATGTDAGDTAHNHGDTSSALTSDWPRAWDPTKPIDLSGVPGVSAEQEARAKKLVEDTLKFLPKWSTTDAAVADGYRSIGDAGTGSEHFIKVGLIGDDVMLDPTQPESLVYTVHADGSKTLAGAMFIASARPSDDPTLTEWAGPLMTWHNHGDLCWEGGKVVGVVDAAGVCARGNNQGGQFPMVHVWVEPHMCGVFAALEGVGAGQASVPDDQRVDMCNAHHHDSAAAAEPKPYDPTQPIDLSGMPGVTPEQQAAAENLVAVTLVRLPQWADYRVAEAAGFRSIGDGVTGHEHFIQWDWINDDITLDPDHPESLVYEPQPDGSKKLVSAMYMLPDTVKLEDVPDIGGALTQWHIHDNLCFTADPVQPRVAGLTNGQGNCNAPLVKFRPAPMIHVWITPHKCGPFAALEGVGAGQIQAGEERLCDHAHGSGF
ncbi:MAG: hypothetical protein RI900_2512 [Actinomycetota bacterium]